MRHSWILAWLLAIACGRYGFDPIADDGSSGGDGSAGFVDPFEQIPGLVAWYPMEDEVALTSTVSASDSARDGFCSGSGCPQSVPGRVGKGLRFESTSVVIISNSDMIGTQPFTVAVWSYCTGPSRIRHMIAKTLDPNLKWNVFSLNLTINNRIRYESTDGISFQAIQVDDFDGLDNWHHYAAVWDGSEKRLYVDGVLRASATEPTVLSSAEPILLGQDFDELAYVRPFIGTLDELRIYSRALAPAEIALLANQ